MVRKSERERDTLFKTVVLTMAALVLMVIAGCGPTGPDTPGQPNGLTVTSTSPITLSWNTVSDASSYNVYRSTVSGGITPPSSPLATNVLGTIYADTSTVSGTTYYYQVTAVNTLGESTGSNEVSAVAQ